MNINDFVGWHASDLYHDESYETQQLLASHDELYGAIEPNEPHPEEEEPEEEGIFVLEIDPPRENNKENVPPYTDRV